MPGRVHQNDAPALSLASSIAAGDTVIPVNQSITGVETPISYVINSGGANEEIVTLVDKNTSTSPSQFENCVRGCDGTADQSHSSGEVLTHEATARDLVDKRAVQGQILSPSDRLVAYDDFARSNRGADGDRMPSGQNWTDPNANGNWQIKDQRLEVTNGGGEQILWPTTEFSLKYRAFWQSEQEPKLIVAWQDSNNYLNFKARQFRKVVGGTETAISTGDQTVDEKKFAYYYNVSVTQRSTDTWRVAAWWAGGGVLYEGSDSDVVSIFNNATHVGLMGSDSFGIECYFAFKNDLISV
jgi:hypothetical protein